MLACGSMHFSAGDLALIYSLLGGWLVSFVLAFLNPCLICSLNISGRSQFTHFLVWAIYVGSGLALFLGGLNGKSEAWAIPVLGVPIFAISHFIALLWIRRERSD